MNHTVKEKLKEKLKKMYGKKSINITLPADIKFVEKDTEIEMILQKEAIGKGKKNKNMQKDAAAFEGWAVILKRYFPEKNIKLEAAVELDLEEEKENFVGNGHFNRFLYRALRFQEQYRWFSLSLNLEKVIFGKDGFRDWIEENSQRLTNNIPKKNSVKSIEKTDQIHESWIERSMAGEESILHKVIEDDVHERNEVFRQLPVGLFLDTVATKNEVFIRKKAAIDLWTWSGEQLYIFELKYKNKKIGIITEIFFYANYMYDLHIKEYFNRDKSGSVERGYNNLLANPFTEIYAVMVADEFHPLIDDEVLQILNSNKSGKTIKYKRVKYKMGCEINVTLG